MEKSFVAHAWIQRSVVGLEEYSAHDWRAPPGGGGGGGGGLLSPKTDGGVLLAAESWTPKDRGKNGIWGQKDRIL